MDLVLGPDAGDGIAQAVRTAMARAGVELGRHPSAKGSAWWSAGLADAVEHGVSPPDQPPRYSVARSPRSTRGATRA